MICSKQGTVTYSHSVWSFKTCLVIFVGGDGLVAKLCPTLVTPWTVACQAPLEARILEWVAIPSPGDLPDPGIESRSPALKADSLPTEL